jgi:hypothetical protein
MATLRPHLQLRPGQYGYCRQQRHAAKIRAQRVETLCGIAACVAPISLLLGVIGYCFLAAYQDGQLANLLARIMGIA